MDSPSPLRVLLDPEHGAEFPLPPDISALYGPLAFPLPAGRPYILSNFVTSLDGVVSLGMPGRTDGDAISGANEHDSMVMGLLRAVSDAIIVGAGTLRKSPGQIWTPGHVFPPMAGAFALLRRRIGKEEAPLNVFVTGGGKLDPGLPVFQAKGVPVAIITTRQGAAHLKAAGMPARVAIVSVSEDILPTARGIIDAVSTLLPGGRIFMMEGGPHLLAQFIAEGCLDELFLTLAPQMAGRDGHLDRMGLTAGIIFSPDNPVWGELVSLRVGGSHLFLRYAFHAGEPLPLGERD